MINEYAKRPRFEGIGDEVLPVKRPLGRFSFHAVVATNSPMCQARST
jgi:hypothetical protein